MNKKNKNKKTGFTLIELLVVIFIIGILASLLLANLVGIRSRAEDSQVKSDLLQMKKALRLYYNDNQAYPADDSGVLDSSLISGNSFVDGGIVYMKDLPEEYQYYVDSDSEGEDFRLYAPLSNVSDKEIAKSQQRCPAVTPFNTRVNYSANTYVVCAD